MLTLLQAQPRLPPNSSEVAVRVLAILGVLIVVLLVCGLLVRRFRNGLLGDGATDGGPPLMLDDLRAMKRRGEISEAEYERMRTRLVERVSGRSAPARTPSASGSGTTRVGRPAADARPDTAAEPSRRPGAGLKPQGDPPPRPAPGE